MKNIKNYLFAAVFAVAVFTSCHSNNGNASDEDNVVPDSSTISDSPQAQQPSGYAPGNSKEQNDSAAAIDTLQ